MRAAAFASTVSFRSGPSVFKDQGKLSFDYLPDKMVHREQQTQRLFSLLRPIVEAGTSSNAFLYGPVGTGKTHTRSGSASTSSGTRRNRTARSTGTS